MVFCCFTVYSYISIVIVLGLWRQRVISGILSTYISVDVSFGCIASVFLIIITGLILALGLMLVCICVLAVMLYFSFYLCGVVVIFLQLWSTTCGM